MRKYLGTIDMRPDIDEPLVIEYDEQSGWLWVNGEAKIMRVPKNISQIDVMNNMLNLAYNEFKPIEWNYQVKKDYRKKTNNNGVQ